MACLKIGKLGQHPSHGFIIMFPIEKTSGGCPLFLDKRHLLHSFPVTITLRPLLVHHAFLRHTTRTIPFGAATCGHPLDDWEFSGTSANGDDGFGFLADGGPFLFVPWRRQLGEIKWDAVCWMMLCQWDFGGRRSMPEICDTSESLEIGSLCTSGSKWVSIENSPTPCLMMLKAGDTVVPLNDPCSKTCPATKKNMRWWRWRWYEHVWNIANICKHLQTNDT